MDKCKKKKKSTTHGIGSRLWDEKLIPLCWQKSLYNLYNFYMSKKTSEWVPVRRHYWYLGFPLPTPTVSQSSLTFSMCFRDVYLNSRTASLSFPPSSCGSWLLFSGPASYPLASFNHWAFLVFTRWPSFSIDSFLSSIEPLNDWFAFLWPSKCSPCPIIASHHHSV